VQNDVIYSAGAARAGEGLSATELAMEADLNRRIVAQAPAVAIYGVLMDAFLVETNGFFDLAYPDTYAGAFVDYDTLVIQLTDLSPETIAFYTAILGDDAPVRFEQVEFSLNQLVDFGSVFVDAIFAAGIPLVGHGFCTTNNFYAIEIYYGHPQSLEMIDSFSTMSRFMPIPINIELGAFRKTLSPITGGTPVYHDIAPHSVGMTGFINHPVDGRFPALITSGHMFQGFHTSLLGLRTVSHNRTVIGSMHSFLYGRHSYGHHGASGGSFGIVKLDDDEVHRMTRQTQTEHTMVGVSRHVPVGTIVNGTGRRTNTYRGKVRLVGHTWYSARLPGVSGGLVPGITVVCPWLPRYGWNPDIPESGIFGGIPADGDSSGTIYMLIDSGYSAVFVGVLNMSGSGSSVYEEFGRFAVWGFTPLTHIPWFSIH
jgi:hypothetical protein